MVGDGHLDARAADDALAAEADYPREAAAWTAIDDAIEIDEADGFTVAIGMRDAGPQAARHERQVRVGVLRFAGALHRVEVGAAIEPVVLVAGTFRKDGAECLDEGGDVLFPQARRNAAIEEAGRRVRRPVQAVGVSGERLMFGGETRPQFHHVEARFRSYLEREVQRFGRRHQF